MNMMISYQELVRTFLNNVARLYTQSNVDAIIDAAMDAGDAIDAAFYAPTKQLTITYWQKVFGSSFQG